jgi:hypothetical protein
MANDDPEVTKDILDQIDARLMADGRLTDEERGLLHRTVARYKDGQYRKVEPVEKLVERIVEDGRVTRDELKELHEAIMEDGEVSSEEMMILRNLVAKLSRGELEEA